MLMLAERFDRADEMMRHVVLENVTASARGKDLVDEVLIFCAGKNQHLALRENALDLSGGFKAIELRHTKIHHGNIGARLLRQGDCRAAVAGFGANFPSRRLLDKSADPLPDNFVVIRQENA